MPTPVRLIEYNDMSGGLNLSVDAFQLGANESPVLYNVDIDPSGGFAMRKTAQAQFSEVLDGGGVARTPQNLWAFTSGATEQIVVQAGNDIAYTSGGSFFALSPDALVTAGRMRAASFRSPAGGANRLYIQRNAEQVPFYFDGAAVTVLTSTFNDNFEAPNNGDIPTARYICAHLNYLWVAHTLEAATSYPNRVRWSHPGKAEDWRNDDFITIDDGVVGDEITGIVSFRDSLLVFKNQSVHQVRGFDADSFQVTKIADVGASSQEAIAVTEYGVYFFNWPQGLFLWTGDRVEWVWEKLRPLTEDGTVASQYSGVVTLGWLNRRLWVSIPAGSTTTNNQTFILDPSLRSRGNPVGGWVFYGFGIGPSVQWVRPNDDSLALACSPNTGWVWALDRDDVVDNFIPATPTNFITYFATPWFDAGSPAVNKRWRRPDFVLDGDYTATLTVDVYRDYDPSVLRRSFTLLVEPLASGFTWDSGLWGAGSWGSDAQGVRQEIERGSSLGRARSVQLAVRGPAVNVRWAINSITFKYIPKRVR